MSDAKFTVNGHAYVLSEIKSRQADSAPLNTDLVTWLREEAHLTGTKAPCHEGDCGGCQVLVREPGRNSGFRAQPSCLIHLADLTDCDVFTIEGLVDHQNYQKHPLIRLLTEAGAGQCGFCSPALVIAYLNWLLHGSQLNSEEGEAWLNGNLCRCTGYMGQKRGIAGIVSLWGDQIRTSTNREQTLKDLGLLPAHFPVTVRSTGSGGTYIQSSHSTHPLLGGGTDLYLQAPADYQHPSQRTLGCQQPAYRYQSDVDQNHDDPNKPIMLNARWPIQALAEVLAADELIPWFQDFNHLFASLPVRNRATLAGNLAHASPVGDAITLMLALDCQVITNQRVIPIQSLYSGYKQTCLAPNEAIEWLSLPKDIEQCFVHFEKISRRTGTDIAVLNCASLWRVDHDQIVEVQLAIGGASAIPIRLSAIEQQFLGPVTQSPNAQRIAAHLQSLLTPISDLRGSAGYRQQLAKQLILAQYDTFYRNHRGCLESFL